MKIQFVLVKDIYDFNHLAINTAGEAHLLQDRYRVDAKSILGLFTLDLTRNIELELEDTTAYPYFKQFEAPNV